jgi:hypothetical protein
LYASYDWRRTSISACTASSRILVMMYTCFYYLSYLFLASKSRLARVMNTFSWFETVIFGSTHGVPFLGLLFAFLTTSRIVENGSDAGACVLRLAPLASLTMTVLDIILSACYLYLFIKPLLESNALQQKMSRKEAVAPSIDANIQTEDAGGATKVNNPLYIVARNNIILCLGAVTSTIITMAITTWINFGGDAKWLKYIQVLGVCDMSITWCLYMVTARRLWMPERFVRQISR